MMATADSDGNGIHYCVQREKIALLEAFRDLVETKLFQELAGIHAAVHTMTIELTRQSMEQARISERLGIVQEGTSRARKDIADMSEQSKVYELQQLRSQLDKLHRVKEEEKTRLIRWIGVSIAILAMLAGLITWIAAHVSITM